jgi:hypothetical protein
MVSLEGEGMNTCKMQKKKAMKTFDLSCCLLLGIAMKMKESFKKPNCPPNP